MTERRNRVLIAGGDPDRVLLLEEAFLEMDETRYSRGLRGGWERTYAVDEIDAVTELDRQQFDAILFDQAAMGDAALASMRELRRKAPDAPIVVLLGPDQDALGLALVRQGAQDFLVDTELDCVPLDRALRCSVERQRILVAQRSVSLIDELTGVLNARGFLDACQRDLHLSDRHALYPLVVKLKLRNPGEDPELEVIRAADALCQEACDTDLVGRLGDRLFAIFGLVESELEAELRLQRLESALGSLGAVEGLSGIDVWTSLCDNQPLEDRAGRNVQRR